MNPLEERIHKLFENSVETKISAADTLSPLIAKAGTQLVNCLLKDRKILLCGQGGSLANCLHFTAAMLHHFEVERPSLPAMTLMADLPALTAIASADQYEQVFAKQIAILGQEGDVLLILTTKSHAPCILQAAASAHEKKMDIIVLSGREGAGLTSELAPEDIEICIAVNQAARIREMHLFILHCFCDLIESSLFGQMLE